MKTQQAQLLDHCKMARTLLAQHPILAEKIASATGLAADEADQMLTEVLRFLQLIVVSKQRLTPPLIIDLAWHEFILFTQAYHDFCQKHFGRFVHHQPGGSQTENHRQLRRCLKHYQLHYGSPPTRYWGDHGYYSQAVACGPCSSNPES